MLNSIATGVIAFLLTPDRLAELVPGSNNVEHAADPGRPGRFRGCRSSAARRPGCSASSSSRSSSAWPTGSCWAGPGSASTCAPPGGRSRRRSPAGSTSSGWSLITHDPFRRYRRPGRHAAAARRVLRLLAGLPRRSRLHRHRDRAARPQPPGGHRARRPALGLPRHVPSDPRPRRDRPRRSSTIMQGIMRALGGHRLRAGPPVPRSGPSSAASAGARGRTAHRARGSGRHERDRRDVAADPASDVVKPSRSSGAGCRSPAGAWLFALCGGIGPLLSFVRVITGADDSPRPGPISAAIGLAVPIGMAGLGGLWSERAGVVNIGLEGMMILGTWGGRLGRLPVRDPGPGVLVGALVRRRSAACCTRSRR